MVKNTSPEIAQIEIALAKSYRVAPFKLLLFIFWGLIVAKCCIVEWAILTYSTPINGFLYVWIPSIVFGGVCSLVYARVSFEELRRAPIISRLVRGVWGACAISMIIFSVVSIGMRQYNPFILPGIFAMLMAISYFIHSILDSRKLFKISAAGWWIASIILFYQLNIDSLAGLAVAILLFQTTPTIVLYAQANKNYRTIASQRGANI